MQADGTNLRMIADDGANNGFPSWSPDGARLVYKKDQHLVIYSVADGKTTDLTKAGPQYDNFPQWSVKDHISFTTNRDGDFESTRSSRTAQGCGASRARTASTDIRSGRQTASGSCSAARAWASRTSGRSSSGFRSRMKSSS